MTHMFCRCDLLKGNAPKKDDKLMIRLKSKKNII